MIILKINIVTTQDFYFKTLIYDDVYEHFSISVGFIIVFIRLSQNTMIQKKLIAYKMKDENGGIATEEFLGLELKLY